MAREPVSSSNVTAVYSAHKALHLALCGHSLSPSRPPIEIDRCVVAWFVSTPKLYKAIADYNALQPLFAGSKRRGEPVSLEELSEACKKARQE